MKNNPVSSTYIKAYTQCLLKFYFRYHTKKRPAQEGEARPFGTAVHEALELMYKRLIEKDGFPTEEDYDFVYRSFINSALNNGLTDQSLYEEGKYLLKQRLDSYDPSEKVLGLELKFGLPYNNPEITVSTDGGTPLVGAIDKLFEFDKDTLVVLDYKTSRTALTDEEAAKDEQLSLYDLAASKLFPQYKNIILVLDYLRLGPVISHRTEEQRAWFGTFVDELYAQVSALREEDIKPRLNVFCGWCDYKNYCPKYKEAITDPDLLVKPLNTMSNDEFVKEWIRLGNIRNMVESYKRELSMHASNVIRESGESDIVGDTHTLYKVQSSRVYYDTSTVLNTIPKDDAAGMLSVNKSYLDKYLLDHPEYTDSINKTAKVSFASSFFKSKKTKK